MRVLFQTKFVKLRLQFNTNVVTFGYVFSCNISVKLFGWTQNKVKLWNCVVNMSNTYKLWLLVWVWIGSFSQHMLGLVKKAAKTYEDSQCFDLQ